MLVHNTRGVAPGWLPPRRWRGNCPPPPICPVFARGERMKMWREMPRKILGTPSDSPPCHWLFWHDATLLLWFPWTASS